MTELGAEPSPRHRPLISVAAKVIAVVTLAMGIAMLSGAVEPVDLLLAGRTGPSAAVVEADFPGYTLVNGPGYDGQQYYAIAARLPDIDAASAALDSPRYRFERILAPAIASLAPAGDATVLVLLALNIVGLGLACGALAELCQRRGWPPAIGGVAAVPLAFPLLTSCVDPLAVGLVLTGVALVCRGDHGRATGAFALALLARELLVAIVVVVALVRMSQARSARPILLLLSVLPLAAWHMYLLERVGGGVASQTELFAAFRGPPSLFISFLACILLAATAVIAWRPLPPVAATAAIYLVQLPLFAAGIDWKALPRVAAPAVALGLAAICGAMTQRLVTDRSPVPR